jgi:hypothetical protein
MKLLWRKKTALWAALAVSAAGVVLAAESNGPDVTPTRFALPLQEATGNPVTCMSNAGQALGLGYLMGVKIDGKGTGTWDIYLPSSGSGAGQAIAHGGAGPGAGYGLAGVIEVSDVVGDSNAINFRNAGTFLGVSGVIVKAGSGGSDQASNAYPYEQPPASVAVAGPNNDLTDYGWPDPYPGGFPGPQVEDDALDSPTGITQGISHIELCFQDDAPVVRPPDISKTAVPNWTGYNDWTLDKSVDPTSIDMFDGDTHDANYTITATKDPWGNFTVSGVIELSDPLAQGFTVNSVADTMVFADDPGSTPFHPALACDYVSDGDVFYRCTYSHTMSSKTYEFLAAGGAGVNTAVASVSLNGESVLTNPDEATANFAFPADPVASYGDTLDVDDSMVDGTGTTDHSFTGSGSWGYAHTFSCPDDEGDNPNTAIGSFTGVGGQPGSVQDSANVDVGCHAVQVEKTAYTRFNRDYDWTPDKKIVVRPGDLTVEEKSTHCSLLASGPYVGDYLCDDITIKLPTGGVYDTVYALKATKDAGTDSDRQVYGAIKVSWDADVTDPVFSGDPTDVLSFTSGLPTTISGTVSGCAAGGDQINCSYVADVPDSRSGTNTASVVRPHVCYNADGSTKACAVPASSTYTGQAPFSFGAPTTKDDECVDLSDLFNGTAGLNLGPSFGWMVADELCTSSTFYATGEVVTGKFLDIHADWAPDGFQNYTPACTFYVPNVLKLHQDDDADETDEATIGVYVPDACNQGCTLTQGYWKTHAIYASKPQFAKKRDANWDSVGGESAIFFLSGKTWITVFWTAPKGDAYYNLAHQYMAAVLNKNNGASVPSNVATAIASATAFFQTHQPATLTKADKTNATRLAGILGSYNEGAFGPGHCSEAPISTTQSVMLLSSGKR